MGKKQKIHILFIDDDEDVNQYHKEMILQTGVAVKIKSITDSRKALDYLKKICAATNPGKYKIPEIIFVDINMPAIDGFTLLDKIRKICTPLTLKKNTKIFMLTTSLNPDDFKYINAKYEDLVAGYYIKPLTGAKFLEIMEKYF